MLRKWLKKYKIIKYLSYRMVSVCSGSAHKIIRKDLKIILYKIQIHHQMSDHDKDNKSPSPTFLVRFLNLLQQILAHLAFGL